VNKNVPVLYDFTGLLEKDEITYSWFIQDDATAHIYNSSTKLMNEIFWRTCYLYNLMAPSFVASHFARAAKSAVYRDRPRTLNDLKTGITAYIKNIS
jgi:hypothetical protein